MSRRTLPMILLALCLMLGAAAEAGADYATCPGGDLCLWDNPSWSGGRFNFYGSDQNLNNDYFVGTLVKVGNHATSAYNHGYAGAYDDVKWYDGASFTGASACLPVASRVDLSAVPYNGQNWDNRIESYAWVPSC